MIGRVLAASAALACSLLLGACHKSSPAALLDGGADLAAADGPPSLLAPECDVLADSGCPAGQRCTIGSENGAPRDLCFPVAAQPLGEGFQCAPVVDGTRTGDSCAAGLVCMPLTADYTVCRRPCYQRSDCGSGQGCVVPSTTSTLRSNDAGTFVLRGCANDVQCDPIAQDVCPAGFGCYLSTYDDVGRVSECLQPGLGQAGSVCSIITDCAPGFRCDGFFCRRYCYYNGADGGVGGSCPADEGLCDLFTVSGGTYGICGAE